MVSLGLFFPVTSLVKGYPFEVALPEAGCVNGADSLNFGTRYRFILLQPGDLERSCLSLSLALWLKKETAAGSVLAHHRTEAGHPP